MITKKYYKLVKVSYEDEGYFYMENISDQTGNFSVYKNGSTQWTDVEYSTDGVNWNSYSLSTLPTVPVVSGGRIYVRGNGRLGGTGGNGAWCSVRMDVDHIVGGNIYSLIDKTTFSTRTTATNNSYELIGAFRGNTHLVSAEKLNFGNVTTLAQSSFESMFKGCTALTTAPTLTPTTLASGCYQYMFEECSSLTKGPDIKATTLANACFNRMFGWGANKINTIKIAILNWNTSYSPDWLVSAPNSGTIYAPTGSDIANYSGTSGVPSGWTVVYY